jgi:hypothetical protein
MKGLRAFSMLPIVWLSAVAALADDPAVKPEGGPGSVTLPLGDYDRLVERAAHPIRRPDSAPVDAAVGAADLRVRIDGDAARASARLEGEVFTKGPAAVRLSSGATIMDARLGRRALPLMRAAEEHRAVLEGPSSFAIDLDLAVGVQPETGGASLRIPAIHAGSLRAVIDVPGTSAEVTVTPGVVVSRSSADGRTRIEATLEPHAPTRVTWTSREAAAPVAPRESRWLSDVKTLVTLEDADLRVTALVQIDVVQGEPARFEIDRPAGFEVIDVSGPSIEAAAIEAGHVGVTVAKPAERRHQFLLLLERATTETTLAPPLLAVRGAQRETGEVAVEGAGTLELATREGGTLKPLDVRELSPALRGLAGHPLLAGFRYHRRPSDPPTLALEVRRFPDAPVLAALADVATVTTLATVQGRMLTEVALTVRNHAQAFLKVDLPADAQLLSAEVAGQRVKPVQGSDGTRVPLLRAGFRPNGPYAVSFVYTHSGAAFRKKGEARLALAGMDIPIQVVQWEVFLPDRYRVEARGGNVMRAEDLPSGPAGGLDESLPRATPVGVVGGLIGTATGANRVETLPVSGRSYSLMRLLPGTGAVHGHVTDPSGAALPGATVTVIDEATGATHRATSDANGDYFLNGVAPGRLTLVAEATGFRREETRGVTFDRTIRTDFRMELGSVSEVVTVEASPITSAQYARQQAEAEEEARTAPSANVGSLQRRVAGVLPVDIDVPHAGTSHRFIRTLALAGETTVSFKYRAR